MADLEQAIDCAPTARSQRRFNAMHLLYLDVSIETVLKHSRVSERTLRFWIRQFNLNGLDGLKARPVTGRPRKITAKQFADRIAPLLEAPSKAGQRHWTMVKLHGYLTKNNIVESSYSTLLRHAHQNNYKRLFPRPTPEPPSKDLWHQKRKAFAQGLEMLMAKDDSRLFFCDESGFEGDPRPRQRWCKKGSYPRIGYYGGHLRRTVIGAIEPTTGELTTIITSHCNTEVFQAFLDTFAKEHIPNDGQQIYLILDNATWHKAKSLNWHHIIPIYLPPYSPDYNPIENLWLYIKQQYLADFITNDGDELTQEIAKTIRLMIDQTQTTQSICSIPPKKKAINGKSF